MCVKKVRVGAGVAGLSFKWIDGFIKVRGTHRYFLREGAKIYPLTLQIYPSNFCVLTIGVLKVRQKRSINHLLDIHSSSCP